MEDSPQEKLNAILDQAFDLEGAALAAYLDKTCANNMQLREKVEACLSGADAAVPTGFISDPVPGVNVAALNLVALKEEVSLNHNQFKNGDTVGVYRILEMLGEGGMGEVYLAERNDNQFHRKVAIKIVKAGMGTQEVLTRFHYERQILANLKHPNIAQLLYGDVTETGLPYFVMEYVEGKPITEYCDAHRLPMRARLKLFKTVCDAVRHAQRNQVIHRDLKPSNILVTAEGEVKLLDFGIAKLLAKDGEGEDLYTATGTRGPFTPAYASPEQVHGQPVDTSADVYALGVILYELLTGRRPYELDRNGLTPDNMRLICEHIPSIPSNVVTRRFLNEQSEVPGTLSDHRASEPLKLRRLLRGDVDAIVMKALKKEPERRYPSAAELWSDVNYYLLNRPISARHDSSRYRAFKFVQRHKLSMAALTFAVFALVGGLVVSIASSRIATSKANLANTTVSILVGMFQDINPDNAQAKNIEPRQLISAGLKRVEPLDNAPAVQAEVLYNIAKLSMSMGMIQSADSLYRVALELGLSELGAGSELVGDVWLELGQLSRTNRKFAESELSLRKALQIKEKRLGADDKELVKVKGELAFTLYTLDKYEESSRLYQEVIGTLKLEHAEDSLQLAGKYRGLGHVLVQQNKYNEALASYQQALDIQQALLGPSNSTIGVTLYSMAMCLEAMNELERAVQIHEQALDIYKSVYSENHHLVASSNLELGIVYHKLEDYAQAKLHFLEAANGYGKYFNAKGHLWKAIPYIKLGQLEYEYGNYADAEMFLRTGLGHLRSPDLEDAKTSSYIAQAKIMLMLSHYQKIDSKLASSYLSHSIATGASILKNTTANVDQLCKIHLLLLEIDQGIAQNNDSPVHAGANALPCDIG